MPKEKLTVNAFDTDLLRYQNLRQKCHKKVMLNTTRKRISRDMDRNIERNMRDNREEGKLKSRRKRERGKGITAGQVRCVAEGGGEVK